MGFINVADKTINAKLVYYGVGMGGKTTSLQAVHGIMCPRNEVQLVSINTEEDATLLFDFLPINLGQIEGFKIRIQGFTVPGQPKYRQMRKYVLAGADAVVFVVDSERSRLEENVQSLENMRENLNANGVSEDIPIVLQYNKRDLEDILTEEELDESFKFRDGIEAFPSIATESQGVFEAFVHAAGQLVEQKVGLYGLGRGEVPPDVVAESARRKLWEICDDVLRDPTQADPDLAKKSRLEVRDGKPEPELDFDDEPAPPKTKRKAKTKAKAKAKPKAKPKASAKGQKQDAPQGNTDEGHEDFELEYELRDRAGKGDLVLTDADLDVELGLDQVVEPDETTPEEECDDSLLDKTIQTNLELARKFGDLDEYKSLLEKKNTDLVEAAQNTVHDLNRPVAAVKLMLSTMHKGYLGELAGPIQDAVGNGLVAVQQMERLIQDLLDSSRLDHDGVTLNFQDTDMMLLVADVVRTMRYEIEDRDVRVRLEPLPVIRGDAWALTKVFNNLIGNAIQYTDADRIPTVRIWSEEEADETILNVADNGIGIPEADRPRLFRRFERGTNTGGISGTGLGLHIVKEIVAGHGGEVTFDSVTGHGTCFRIHIPKAPVQPAHSSVSETAAKHDL